MGLCIWMAGWIDGWQSFQRINVVEAYDMRLAMAMVCDTALVEAKCRPNRTSEGFFLWKNSITTGNENIHDFWSGNVYLSRLKCDKLMIIILFSAVEWYAKNQSRLYAHCCN